MMVCLSHLEKVEREAMDMYGVHPGLPKLIKEAVADSDITIDQNTLRQWIEGILLLVNWRG